MLEKIKKLEEENKKLREENEILKKKINKHQELYDLCESYFNQPKQV